MNKKITLLGLACMCAMVSMGVAEDGGGAVIPSASPATADDLSPVATDAPAIVGDIADASPTVDDADECGDDDGPGLLERFESEMENIGDAITDELRAMWASIRGLFESEPEVIDSDEPAPPTAE